MESLFNRDENFMPSKNTLNTWLFLKREPKRVADKYLPGMFVHSDSSIFIVGFFVILLLEFGATFIAKDQAGVEISFILFLILIDIIIAFAAHWPSKNINISKNYLIIIHSDKKTGLEKEKAEDEVEKYEMEIRRSKNWMRLFQLIIILLAFVKTYFIMRVVDFDYTSILVYLPFVMYLIAAFLHIICTGYFLFGLYFNFRIKKEHKKRRRDEYNITKLEMKPVKYTFNGLAGNESIVPIVRYKHSLRWDRNNSTTIVEFHGALTDHQLQDLYGGNGNQISPECKNLIIDAGIEYQLSLLK